MIRVGVITIYEYEELVFLCRTRRLREKWGVVCDPGSLLLIVMVVVVEVVVVGAMACQQ